MSKWCTRRNTRKYCSQESKQGGRVSTSLWPVSDRAPCQPEVFLSASLDPGLAPTWETHRGTYEHTHTAIHKDRNTHTNTVSHRHTYGKRERERGLIKNREHWLKMTGWEVYGQSHKQARKPAPWIYLFDFASSVHRSLRVRATVFNCWPQTPHAPSPAAPSSSSLWEYKLWKEILFICLFPPLPLKWCMEVTHRHGREKKEGKGGWRRALYEYPVVPHS